MRESDPLVCVVILNWNGAEHLPVCLASLRRQSYENMRALMVDNGSSDGSIGLAEESFPGMEIITNAENLGFARANNQGLDYALGKGAKYVIFLNNDTECDENFVSELVRAAESDPRIAACAPKIMYFSTRDIINGIGTEVSLFGYGWDRGMGEKDEGQYDEACDVFGISGGAMLIRAELMKEVGAFDPTYFIYFEDIDLSWRLRMWGYRIIAVPEAVVYHKFSATMGGMKLRREFLAEKNRIRGVLKNFQFMSLARILPRVLYSDFQKIKCWALERGDSESVKRCLMVMAAYVWNLLHSISLFRWRRFIAKGRKLGDSEMMRFITPVMGGSTAVIPHYRIVNRVLFEKISHPPGEIVMGVSDGNSLGAGWGNLFHICGGGIARWTSKKAYFYLPGRVMGQSNIILDLIGSPRETIDVSIEINSMEIGRFSVFPQRKQRISLSLPLSASSQPVLECSIACAQTWTPHQVYRNRDFRRLGVSVSRITLEDRGRSS